MTHAATFKPKADYKKHNDAMRAKFGNTTYHCALCHVDVNYYAKSAHLRSLKHLKAIDRVEEAKTKVAKPDPKVSLAYRLFTAKFKANDNPVQSE